jgi:hypothetical protein
MSDEKTDHIRMRYPIKMSHSHANVIHDLCNRVDRAEARVAEMQRELAFAADPDDPKAAPPSVCTAGYCAHCNRLIAVCNVAGDECPERDRRAPSPCALPRADESPCPNPMGHDGPCSNEAKPDVVAEVLKAGDQFMSELTGVMDRGIVYAALVHMRKRAYDLGALSTGSEG